MKGFDVNNTGDDGGWMVARSDAGADADAGSDPRPARANQGGFRGGGEEEEEGVGRARPSATRRARAPDDETTTRDG